LISVRRVLTEPKTVLAGGKLETFAGFEASMALFNAKIVSSCPLCCCGSVSMVKVVAREVCGVKAVRKVPNPGRDDR
jgi:hypothetical protein